MLKNNLSKIIVGIFALTVFIFGFRPITTYDTFFGLKIGEIVATTGKVPQTEQFSWSAQGRPIVAYEWLAQTWVYLLHSIGGFQLLEVYVALMLTAFFLIVLALQIRAFDRDGPSSAIVGLFLTISIHDFFVARPQIIGFVGYVAVLYLIFLFILKNRNLLFLLIPITYLWTNSHASFIMIPFFLFSYAVLGFLYHRPKDRKRADRTFRLLFIYAVATTIVTIFPPLWYKPYTFLFTFSHDLGFMTQFVSEWGPLSTNPAYQIFYIMVIGGVLLTSIILSMRNHKKTTWLLALPLLGIMIASFQAIRHVPLGTTAAIIMLTLFLPKSDGAGKPRAVMMIPYVLLLVVTIFLGVYKRLPTADMTAYISPDYMEKDMVYLKQANLHGHMFNEFALGGYLIYELYPQYQVFFDGRADIYHDHEMRDFWPLIQSKNSTPDAFAMGLQKFLNQYRFSYLILPNFSYNPLDIRAITLIANAALDNPDWRLIYVSDFIQVFVKNDGNNPDLFAGGFSAITPFEFRQYKAGQEKAAIQEYERMTAIEDSAIARNALGDLYASEKNVEKAKEEYERALQLNPEMGRADIGLGKIALQMNNMPAAVSYFTRGIAISPYWGQGYLSLAKAYEAAGALEQARQTLETGLKQNIDFISVRDMATELNKLQ
ncbi:MAG TPA: tetratricopeptide repeat protein [Patescibacteria group bacterium]|nr:tetratricopeptide repeat protein [Patescibacteria group bacterium]